MVISQTPVVDFEQIIRVKVQEFEEFGVSEIQWNISEEQLDSQHVICPHGNVGSVELEHVLCVSQAVVAAGNLISFLILLLAKVNSLISF